MEHDALVIQSMNKSEKKILLQLLVTSFFWGTSFAAAKIGLRQLEPVNLVVLRFIIASLIFGLLFLKFEQKKLKIELRDVPMFVLLGFLSVSSYFLIQYTALKITTTINSSIIIGLAPIMTALLAARFADEPLTSKKILGILLAFLGVYAIITKGKFIFTFNSGTIKGDMLILLNSLLWPVFTLLSKTVIKKYEPIVVTGYITIFGTIQLLPFIFYPGSFAKSSLLQILPDINLKTIIAALYLAAACTVFSYYIWYKAISILGASKTSVFLYLNPVFTILAGVLLLNEKITIFVILGAITTFSGVYLATGKDTQKSQNKQIN